MLVAKGDLALELRKQLRRADDGAGTVLRHLDRGPTGLATKTRDFGYHGPGRGAGNSIEALLDARGRLAGTISPGEDYDNALAKLRQLLGVG